MPRSALLTIYKTFVRPHFDYGDIIFEQDYSSSIHQKTDPSYIVYDKQSEGQQEVLQKKNFTVN